MREAVIHYDCCVFGGAGRAGDLVDKPAGMCYFLSSKTKCLPLFSKVRYNNLDYSRAGAASNQNTGHEAVFL